MVMFVIERSGDRSVTRDEIEAPFLRIGRDASAELRSDDSSVSLDHAVIESDNDGYTIVDRGSVTGTYVGMNAVERARLHRGDRIEIGDLRLEIVQADPGRPLVMRLTVAAVGLTEIASIDYVNALSLRRPWLSTLTLAAILSGAAIAIFATGIATGDRRAFLPGGFSSAHSRVQGLEQCDQCHQPFQHVSRAACERCHHQTGHATMAADRGPRCAQCHAEHRGQKVLAAIAPGECTSRCHRSVVFGANHPEFPVASTPGFDHGVQAADTCQSCHELEPNGLFGVRRFKSAAFTHTRHRQIACARCHGDDGRLPSQAICTECHGARARVDASPCVTCHRYHRAAAPSDVVALR